MGGMVDISRFPAVCFMHGAAQCSVFETQKLAALEPQYGWNTNTRLKHLRTQKLDCVLKSVSWKAAIIVDIKT